MTSLFDAVESDRRREQGMQLAADHRRELLVIARTIAVEIAGAREDRTCTADDVARELERRGLEQLGNAAGSLFTGKGWRWTGEFVKSERKNAHRNLLRKWLLVLPSIAQEDRKR